MNNDQARLESALVEEKWQVARKRLVEWQKKLRSGACDFVIQALVRWA